jgi:molybdenum cofactor guanylyltransferase
MGRDKALIDFNGAPLWQHQRDILARAGAAEIFLSARPDQEWAHGAPGFSALLYDAQSGCGPIIGLTAGLERASHSHLAVLAIDLPRLTPDWFAMLLGETSAGLGAVGVRDGRFEPLAAIYPRELKWLAWETVASGNYSLQKFLRAAVAQQLMRAHEITDAEAVLFENWNEPVRAGRRV